MISTAQLGRSGAAFTRLGLGTWAIGGPWRFGWGPVDDAESIAAIRRAVDEGVNWIDTAAVYGLGHAEEIVGRALKGYAAGHELFVCTKCGRKTRPDGAPYGDQRPQSIQAECEASNAASVAKSPASKASEGSSGEPVLPSDPSLRIQTCSMSEEFANASLICPGASEPSIVL